MKISAYPDGRIVFQYPDRTLINNKDGSNTLYYKFTKRQYNHDMDRNTTSSSIGNLPDILYESDKESS